MKFLNDKIHTSIVSQKAMIFVLYINRFELVPTGVTLNGTPELHDERNIKHDHISVSPTKIQCSH